MIWKIRFPEKIMNNPNKKLLLTYVVPYLYQKYESEVKRRYSETKFINFKFPNEYEPDDFLPIKDNLMTKYTTIPSFVIIDQPKMVDFL